MKLAVQLGCLAAANLALNFLFQLYAFAQLGAGVKTDALFAAMTVPQLVLAVISGSLMHVLVPLFSGGQRTELRQIAWQVSLYALAVFLLLALALYVTASWWVLLTVPGFEKLAQDMTVALTRVQLIGMIFAGVNGVQWAYYHAQNKFIFTEVISLVTSAISLVALVAVFPRFEVLAVVWISTIRVGVQTILLSLGMGAPRIQDWNSRAIRETTRKLLPLLMGNSYYKTEALVDRILLSWAAAGSLSLYYVAQQLYGAATQIFNKAVAAPLVPALAVLHKSGDAFGLRSLYKARLKFAAIIGLGGTALLIVCGQSLLRVLVGHGQITDANVEELWVVLLWLSGVFVGGLVGQLSSSSFYAVGDTSTPTRISVCTYSVYIPAKIFLFLHLGVIGVAFAASLLYIVNFLLQNHFLKKRLA